MGIALWSTLMVMVMVYLQAGLRAFSNPIVLLFVFIAGGPFVGVGITAKLAAIYELKKAIS